MTVLVDVPCLRRRRVAPYDDVLERPRAPLRASIEALHTALVLSDVDQPPRTVAITSAEAGEGKTTVAIALARTAAGQGQRCIVLDGDLHQPAIASALGVPSELGLIDHLARDTAMEDMVQIDFKSGAHFVGAGQPVAHGSALLGSVKMRRLLAALGEVYDLVVIDTAAVLATDDTAALASYVDKTLVLVRWAKTRRKAALAALARLSEADADIAGLVLSRVDRRKAARNATRPQGEAAAAAGGAQHRRVGA